MADEIEVKKVKNISTGLIKMTKLDKLRLVDGTKEMQFVARLGGVATEVFSFTEKKTGEVRTGFRGLFGLRTYAGEAYQGTVCYLPKQAHKNVEERFVKGDLSVQFQYDISLSASEKSGVGYQWMCEPAMSKETQEKANALIQDLLVADLPEQKKLAAPKKKAA